MADADLVLRTRSGDADAFGELWRRHYRSGMTVARSVTSSIDPDDLVQESYTRIYRAILNGGGPNGSFRAYLFTSIRNTAAAWGRARRETAIDELDTVADPASTEASADEELDRGLTALAFRSLPSRWQEVLWYSEIEQMKPAAIGGLLGMSAGAVSQLTFRAREGLREAWIQAHLHSVGEDSECRWVIDQLGAHSRGNLGVRAQQRVDSHLEDCARCMIVATEAKDVSSRLALVLLPLVLGVSGASTYLATLQGGGAPIVALAAMPSSVIEGAVVVTSASGAVAGTSVAGGAGSGSAGTTGAAGSGTAGSTGMLSGIGALVGAGSAALIVAGVVAAATVVPAMLGGSPATSQPSASDTEPSSIASEVVPGSTTTTEDPLVIEVDEADPKTPDAEPPADAPTPPDIDEAAPTPPAPPTEQPADVPDPEATPAPAPEPTPTPEPTPDPAPSPAPDPTPTPTPTPDPGPTDPDSGTGDPGITEPGDGATVEPGDGSEAADSAPTPLTGAPVLGAAVLTVNVPERSAYFSVRISGEANQTVRTQLGDATEYRLLGSDGGGDLQLAPTWQQLCDDATVSYAYVADGAVGEVTIVKLSELGTFSLPPGLCG